jgi:hypothetical protein
VSFQYAGNPDGGPSTKFFHTQVNAVDVQGYTFDSSGRSAKNMGWTGGSFTFRAMTPSTSLAFVSDTPGCYGPTLDDVHVSELAAPLDYGSDGWSFKQTEYGSDLGFEAPSFDDSSWAVGQAGFGTTDGTCPWNSSDSVKTRWDTGTDMLLRHRFRTPTDAVAGLHIDGTIDNNADVYVNGNLVQHVESGSCTPAEIAADIPAADLATDNVLAIRARDLGSATFVDVQITVRAL